MKWFPAAIVPKRFLLSSAAVFFNLCACFMACFMVGERGKEEEE
jgi:hypothetical protein